MQPSGNLAELREFIRARRAALAGFMEQGAALQLNGDVLTVTPLNDIYIRYLNDNRNVIAELASELYGRKIRAELAPLDKSAADRTDGAPAATAPVAVATSSSPTSVGPAPASPPASNPISNSPASNPGANEAIPESRPATPADAAAGGGAAEDSRRGSPGALRRPGRASNLRGIRSTAGRSSRASGPLPGASRRTRGRGLSSNQTRPSMA